MKKALLEAFVAQAHELGLPMEPYEVLLKIYALETSESSRTALSALDCVFLLSRS